MIYKSGYTVMKVDKAKECYAMEMSKDEPTPAQVRLAFRKVNGTFPSSNYWVSKNNMLPLYEIESLILSQSIRRFCGNYPVIKMLVGSTLKEIETMVKNQRIGRNSGKAKRQYTKDVERLRVCQNGSIGQYCSDDKLQINCRPQNASPGCVYKIKCVVNVSNTYTCTSVHDFGSRICCTYTC